MNTYEETQLVLPIAPTEYANPYASYPFEVIAPPPPTKIKTWMLRGAMVLVFLVVVGFAALLGYDTGYGNQPHIVIPNVGATVTAVSNSDQVAMQQTADTSYNNGQTQQATTDQTSMQATATASYDNGYNDMYYWIEKHCTPYQDGHYDVWYANNNLYCN